MRWWVGKETRSAKLAIIISYPASASRIIVLQSNLHVRSPPVATTSHKRQPSQNTKNVLSYSLILEPLVNDHLLQATATTFWADSFRIFYCFQPPPGTTWHMVLLDSEVHRKTDKKEFILWLSLLSTPLLLCLLVPSITTILTLTFAKKT